MARDTLDTWLRLDRVHCYDEGDGWGNAEPYLWAVFFKIDGDTVRLNDSLNLEGTATVVSTNGSHGNLDNTDVDAGDDVPVPEDVGSWHTRLKPIPVPLPLSILVPDVAGVAGVVVVLMEEDNVSDEGAVAGYNALVNEIQQRLNMLIPKLGINHQDVTETDIEGLQNGISDAISNAVQEAQSGWQNFWSWLNADDQIGSKFFSFKHDSLAAGNVIYFSQRWGNEGDWEIFGHANASPTCPAESAAALAESLGSKFSTRDLEHLRSFRDANAIRYRPLARWWDLAQRNSAALAHLFQTDEEARNALLSALPAVTGLLQDKKAEIPPELVEQAMVVLRRAGSSPSSRLRTDAARASELLALLPGRTVSQAVQLTAALEPKRGNKRAEVQAAVRRVSKAGHVPPVRKGPQQPK